MYPKPVQQPPPVHVGGETTAALRRVARSGQGWHTFNRSPEELAKGLRELDAELEAAGRSRDDVRITVCPYFNQLTPEWIDQYAEAGADAVAALFFAFSEDDVARAFDDLEDCLEAGREPALEPDDDRTPTRARSTSTCAPRIPSTLTRRPRSGSPAPAPNADAEADQILAWAADQPGVRGQVGHAVLSTLRYTGLRRNEVSVLRLDGVDLDARRLCGGRQGQTSR